MYQQSVPVVYVLLGGAVGALALFWIFLVFGTRSWLASRKFRLARVFAVLVVLLAAVGLGGWLFVVRDAADPTSGMMVALLAIGLAAVGGILVRLLYQSRHL